MRNVLYAIDAQTIVCVTFGSFQVILYLNAFMFFFEVVRCVPLCFKMGSKHKSTKPEKQEKQEKCEKQEKGTKLDAYNGLSVHGAPNVTRTMV